MEAPDALRQRVQRERRLRERLRRAAFRLAAAQTERRWAIVSAHQQGLSLRQIAAATGLGPTRIHQLLREAASEAIPGPLSRLQEQGWPAPAPGAAEAAGQEDGGALAARLGDEAALLRASLDWLERLEREASVAVNLRPEDDPEREYVPFDRARVLLVLRRIAADLDELSRVPNARLAASRPPSTDPAENRRRLAEPPLPPPRRSAREARAALRAAAGLEPLP